MNKIQQPQVSILAMAIGQSLAQTVHVMNVKEQQAAVQRRHAAIQENVERTRREELESVAEEVTA